MGDIGNGLADDLAVGIPGRAVAGEDDAGAVNVMYGSPAGLMSERSEIWSQRSAGIADVAERLDSFGASLVAADFGRGSTLDLAIGVPGESVRGSLMRVG